MLYNCPQHGLNCPHNFNFNNNSRLALKGASAVPAAEDTNNNKPKMYILKTIKPEVKFQSGSHSLDNIRNMFGLGNNIVSNNNNNQLKGASEKQEIICPKIQSKIQSLIDIKNLFGLT